MKTSPIIRPVSPLDESSPSIVQALHSVRIIWTAAGALALIGMLASAFFDLKLSSIVYSPGTVWAVIFAYIGPQPIYINLMAAIWLLFDPAAAADPSAASSEKSSRIRKIIFLILGTLLIAVLVDMNQYHLSGSVFNWFLIAQLILTIGGGRLLYRCFQYKERAERIQAALFLILSAALCMALVAIIKDIWHRPRYIALQALDPVQGQADLSAFKNWWQISWERLDSEAISALKAIDSDLFKSFVSGHTASAAACFSSLIVLLYNRKADRHRILLALLCFAWTILTACSRIVLGKHYLSDVSGGLLVSIGAAFLASFIIYRRKS